MANRERSIGTLRNIRGLDVSAECWATISLGQRRKSWEQGMGLRKVTWKVSHLSGGLKGLLPRILHPQAVHPEPPELMRL